MYSLIHEIQIAFFILHNSEKSAEKKIRMNQGRLCSSECFVADSPVFVTLFSETLPCVEFLRALGNQSGVSVWQYIYSSRLAMARSFIRQQQQQWQCSSAKLLS